MLFCYSHLVRDQVGTVEANTELSNHGDVATSCHGLHESLGPRLCNGSQVVDQLVLGHANARVLNGQGRVGLVRNDLDEEVGLSLHPTRLIVLDNCRPSSQEKTTQDKIKPQQCAILLKLVISICVILYHIMLNLNLKKGVCAPVDTSPVNHYPYYGSLNLVRIRDGLIPDLVQGIRRIGDQLSQKDLLVGVERVDDKTSEGCTIGRLSQI